MIINIRGTNGSGKTTAVRTLIDYWKYELVSDHTDVNWLSDERKVAHLLTPQNGERALFVVGRYDQSPCGGCDRLKTQDQITNLIQLGIKQGHHVVFEGAIVSTIWERYAFIAQAHPTEFVFAWMATPFDVCLERIRERQRATARGERPVKTEQVRAKYDLMTRQRQKAIDSGLLWSSIDYKDPLPDLLGLLEVDT